MKRAERSEFNYIKSSLKNRALGYGCTLTIRTDASSEYKQALNELYTGLNFHPAAVSADDRRFDGKERVLYIFNRTWQDNEGNDHSWEDLYTAEEKARFQNALS